MIQAPPAGAAALAGAIERVLATPETAARMGVAAKAHIARFSFEQDVAGLRQALASCVPGFDARRATGAVEEGGVPL